MQLADLTDRKFLEEQGIAAGELSCEWLHELSEGKRPVSWSIHDRLRNDWSGIRVPSFARMARNDMHNIVLWRWQDLEEGKISVFDPGSRLPKNQKSWE